MIINHWAPEFRQQYGGVLPDDYFCGDIESSGFSREKDLILEWGHVQVRDRKVVDKMSILINWFDSDVVSKEWLDNQLRRIKRQMELSDRPWRINRELLEDEGVSPKKAIPWIYDMVQSVTDTKTLMVFHNGLGFDIPMLLSHFRQDLQKDFTFGPNQIFDTSAVEKASQLLDHPRALPLQGESMATYFRRISGWRAAGVYHNLDTHCMKKYHLDEDPGIKSASCHTAEQDAYCVHLLFEKFRELAEQLQVAQAMPRAAVPPINPQRAETQHQPSAGVRYRKQRNR